MQGRLFGERGIVCLEENGRQSSFPRRKNARYICLGPTSSKISLKGPFVRSWMLRDRTRLRKGFSQLSSDLKQHKDRFRSVALDRL